MGTPPPRATVAESIRGTFAEPLFTLVLAVGCVFLLAFGAANWNCYVNPHQPRGDAAPAVWDEYRRDMAERRGQALVPFPASVGMTFTGLFGAIAFGLLTVGNFERQEKFGG